MIRLSGWRSSNISFTISGVMFIVRMRFSKLYVGAGGIVCRVFKVKTFFRVSSLSAGEVDVVSSSLFRELILSLDLSLDFAWFQNNFGLRLELAEMPYRNLF